MLLEIVRMASYSSTLDTVWLQSGYSLEDEESRTRGLLQMEIASARHTAGNRLVGETSRRLVGD